MSNRDRENVIVALVELDNTNKLLDAVSITGRWWMKLNDEGKIVSYFVPDVDHVNFWAPDPLPEEEVFAMVQVATTDEVVYMPIEPLIYGRSDIYIKFDEENGLLEEIEEDDDDDDEDGDSLYEKILFG